VAALAADPDVARKSGGIYTARALSEEYGFTDIDGSPPDHAVLSAAVEQAFSTFLAPAVEAARSIRVDWTLSRKEPTA
jgi:hypothetical protein